VSSIEIDVEGEGSIIGRGEEEEMSSLVHFELFSFNLIFFVVPLVRKEEVEEDDDKGDDDEGDDDKGEDDEGEDDEGEDDIPPMNALKRN
jgi:hypothetical protein